jgi:hypothetical protein
MKLRLKPPKNRECVNAALEDVWDAALGRSPR